VLAALQIEPYDLPDSVESRTPMGVKLVINKWRGKDGESYISLDMVYQTVRQLRERTMLDLNNPPAVFPLKLQGITQNEYGLYPVKDVVLRFDSAIAGYKSVRKNAE
jgi:glucose-1-phosphatase